MIENSDLKKIRNEIVSEFSRRLHADGERKIAQSVKGALKSCIHDHGDITLLNLDHAMKRVDSQVWVLIKQTVNEVVEELEREKGI
jgi:hypothetical protein